MLSVVALVGRPNVGKSTLFNRLTATRDALVADLPGLTRDRQYGYAKIGGRTAMLVDTGGLAGEGGLAEAAETQTWQAIAEADHVLFMVDARSGLTPPDMELAQRLRGSGQKVWLLANKSEGLQPTDLAEFHALGFARLFAVSAERGSGLPALVEALEPELAVTDAGSPGAGVEGSDGALPVTVIGRPNVGKSTLVNRLLGEERLVASDVPGTTRDAIRVPMVRDGRDYILIDTAGFRRRSSVGDEGPERLGVLAAVRALESAIVAIVMTDATEGITSQDQRLIRLALERGRAVVVALNKWDGLDSDTRHHATVTADRKLAFAPYVRQLHISALKGSGLRELMRAVDEAGRAARAELTTARLNRVLEELVADNPPPLVRGRRIKLRYAHPAGNLPPRIVISGTQVDRLPGSYKRYLANGFREAFALTGVPLGLQFEAPPNPYAGRPSRQRGTKGKRERGASPGKRKRKGRH
ncbi:MAG TPA: ribosome biogenesis GTPase Der [Gammaproteobacteria bacterium]|nr:ribosome biogenesis GTPase Der [Gammaproteobacteria bacterium]